MKIRNPYTFKIGKNDYESLRGDKIVVPDEAYTVRELFQRHANGMMPNIGLNPVYDSGADLDSLDLEKMRNMDLFELEELRTSMANEMLDQEEKVKKARKEQKRLMDEQKKEFEELRKLIEAKKGEKGEPLPPDK